MLILFTFLINTLLFLCEFSLISTNRVNFLGVVGKQIIPMLLLHGWPGSIREFYEIIPLLSSTKPDQDFVFEFVVPSLPGYGFSEGASKPGLGVAQVAVVFKDLMARLGHTRFLIQGGDWGSIIGASLSVLFPQNVIAYHSNMCPANTLRAKLQMLLSAFFPSLLVEEYKQEEYPSQFSNLILESGYFHLQATKPDTVGVALSNSPAGLAAYILEKFSTWTNKSWRDLPDGGLSNYDMSSLIDNVMIYWVTNSISTSVRLYAETFSAKNRETRIDEIPITVPTGCARFDQEILFSSESMLRTQFLDLVTVTYHKKGGHFAAFEQPKLLAEDILNFVLKLRTRKIENETK